MGGLQRVRLPREAAPVNDRPGWETDERGRVGDARDDGLRFRDLRAYGPGRHVLRGRSDDHGYPAWDDARERARADVPRWVDGLDLNGPRPLDQVGVTEKGVRSDRHEIRRPTQPVLVHIP